MNFVTNINGFSNADVYYATFFCCFYEGMAAATAAEIVVAAADTYCNN